MKTNTLHMLTLLYFTLLYFGTDTFNHNYQVYLFMVIYLQYVPLDGVRWLWGKSAWVEKVGLYIVKFSVGAILIFVAEVFWGYFIDRYKVSDWFCWSSLGIYGIFCYRPKGEINLWIIEQTQCIRMDLLFPSFSFVCFYFYFFSFL